MKARKSPLPRDADDEVCALIATLHESGRRLEHLTAGEVDTVADRDGRTFLLQRAQDHLRHTEAAKQAAILNALPAHIAMLDAQGVIISVNEAWRQFAGANVIQGPGYGIGLNYLEICNSARGDASSDAHQVADGIRSVLGGAVKSFSIEYHCHMPTEQRYFLLTVTPLADDHPSGAVVMHLDVTAERRSEESLRASELRFRQMAENIREVFWLTDPAKNQILYISPAYEEIWGRGCENLYTTPREWIDAIHPEDRERVLHAAQTKQASGTYVEEYRIVRPDGAIRWIRDRAFPVFRNEREVYRIAGLAEDITESRRAAEELRRSESLKSAIFESSLDCVLTIDHEGKIVEFNPAAEAAFRLTRDQALGKDMVELIVPPRLRDAHRRGFAHYLATGEGPILGKRLELEAIRADGTEFPIELAITAIGATSRPMFTGFIRDITPRKEADGKIKRLNRVHAVLSGISTLTVRVHERRELFNGACRIAVEHGNFGMAWIGLFDPVTGDVTPVAWAGESAEEITKDKASARDNPPRGQGAVGRAIRERRPVFNNDITALTFRGPRLQEILRAGFRSQIALPLFEDQVVVGTLTMYARESNFFDDEELRLLTELAGAISFAIENISRQQRLDELARIRAVSSEINAAIIRIRERKALLEETCRIVSEHGKFEMVWIGAIDQDGQEVRAIAWRGFSEETARAVTGANINATQGTLGEAIQTRKPSVRNDIEAQLSGGELRQEALKQGCRSSMCLPVVVDDKVTALIVLFTTRREFFDDEEIALLNEMAGNISFALEHIQKEEKIGRLSRIQAVKGSINALIVRVCDRDELFTEACRIAVEHGNFGMAWIGAFDPATQDVTPVAWAGESAEEITRAKSSAQNDTPRGQGAVGRAIRERRLVFNNDITAHSFGGPRLQEILKVGFRSQITLPLFEEQAVVATLTMYAGEPNFFDDEELRLLTELSGDISFALENISRQQKLEKLARIRAVSSETNAAIIRIHEREALLRETCRIAETYGNFKLVWVATLDQEKQKLQPLAWKGFAPEAANAVSWASMSARGTMREAILTRKPAVRNDIQDMPVGSLRQEALQKGCGSSVCLPLMVDDNVVALIVLFAPGVGFFDEEELTLLNEVASNISFALHAIDKNERVDYLAYYDVLTGLANRSLFLERVGQYMRSAVSGGHKLAVGLIDLERFKNINDSLGQAGGDALLKQVAEWLTRNLGDPNLSARVGADHFAVVLPEIRKEGDVARLVEKLVEAFLEHPFRLNDTVFRIAAKVGVALFPDDGAEADALFKNAEAALKKAKASGERYLFYTQKMNDSVATKLTLENQLRQALDNEEFVLHYQPKVNLASGKLTSAEALIRWNDPRTGLVPPGRFIPVLEETGLIYEVGRWALRKAIEDYLRWRNAGLAAVRIAVNVSPLQLRNRAFIAEIKEVIGIDAHAAAGLELEITEGMIMENVKHSVASLQAIRAMGVTIAIDDFGTGYSSLGYLSKLPVHTLKIDRSFVNEMTGAPEGLALVSTIINLAHALKLKVVAEGVETEEQSRLLRLLNCDEMQGFLFSKPVPGEIFEAKFLLAPAAG